MPDTPLRFDHLALPVYDAAKTLHFYNEVLQLPLVDALSGDDWGGKPWLMMFFGTGSGQLLALCALRGAQPPRADGLPADVRHYAFAVSSPAEQEHWKKRLREHGIIFSEEDHGAQPLTAVHPGAAAPAPPSAAIQRCTRCAACASGCRGALLAGVVTSSIMPFGSAK